MESNLFKILFSQAASGGILGYILVAVFTYLATYAGQKKMQDTIQEMKVDIKEIKAGSISREIFESEIKHSSILMDQKIETLKEQIYGLGARLKIVERERE